MLKSATASRGVACRCAASTRPRPGVNPGVGAGWRAETIEVMAMGPAGEGDPDVRRGGHVVPQVVHNGGEPRRRLRRRAVRRDGEGGPAAAVRPGRVAARHARRRGREHVPYRERDQRRVPRSFAAARRRTFLPVIDVEPLVSLVCQASLHPDAEEQVGGLPRPFAGTPRTGGRRSDPPGRRP